MAPGLPIPPALPPLSAGIRGVASVLEKGPRALAPHADMETPALGSPARPGEQAAVPNYLTGPHSACHAMDHGQERLWGQKRHSLVTPHTPPPHPEQPEGPWGSGESRIGEEGLAPHRKGNQHISVILEACKKCFKWLAWD